MKLFPLILSSCLLFLFLNSSWASSSLPSPHHIYNVITPQVQGGKYTLFMTIDTTASEYYLRILWPFYIGDEVTASVAKVNDPCSINSLSWWTTTMVISEIEDDDSNVYFFYMGSQQQSSAIYAVSIDTGSYNDFEADFGLIGVSAVSSLDKGFITYAANSVFQLISKGSSDSDSLPKLYVDAYVAETSQEISTTIDEDIFVEFEIQPSIQIEDYAMISLTFLGNYKFSSSALSCYSKEEEESDVQSVPESKLSCSFLDPGQKSLLVRINQTLESYKLLVLVISVTNPPFEDESFFEAVTMDKDSFAYESQTVRGSFHTEVLQPSEINVYFGQGISVGVQEKSIPNSIGLYCFDVPRGRFPYNLVSIKFKIPNTLALTGNEHVYSLNLYTEADYMLTTAFYHNLPEASGKKLTWSFSKNTGILTIENIGPLRTSTTYEIGGRYGYESWEDGDTIPSSIFTIKISRADVEYKKIMETSSRVLSASISAFVAPSRRIAPSNNPFVYSTTMTGDTLDELSSPHETFLLQGEPTDIGFLYSQRAFELVVSDNSETALEEIETSSMTFEVITSSYLKPSSESIQECLIFFSDGELCIDDPDYSFSCIVNHCNYYTSEIGQKSLSVLRFMPLFQSFGVPSYQTISDGNYEPTVIFQVKDLEFIHEATITKEESDVGVYDIYGRLFESSAVDLSKKGELCENCKWFGTKRLFMENLVVLNGEFNSDDDTFSIELILNKNMDTEMFPGVLRLAGNFQEPFSLAKRLAIFFDGIEPMKDESSSAIGCSSSSKITGFKCTFYEGVAQSLNAVPKPIHLLNRVEFEISSSASRNMNIAIPVKVSEGVSASKAFVSVGIGGVRSAKSPFSLISEIDFIGVYSRVKGMPADDCGSVGDVTSPSGSALVGETQKSVSFLANSGTGNTEASFLFCGDFNFAVDSSFSIPAESSSIDERYKCIPHFSYESPSKAKRHCFFCPLEEMGASEVTLSYFKFPSASGTFWTSDTYVELQSRISSSSSLCVDTLALGDTEYAAGPNLLKSVSASPYTWTKTQQSLKGTFKFRTTNPIPPFGEIVFEENEENSLHFSVDLISESFPQAVLQNSTLQTVLEFSLQETFLVFTNTEIEWASGTYEIDLYGITVEDTEESTNLVDVYTRSASGQLIDYYEGMRIRYTSTSSPNDIEASYEWRMPIYGVRTQLMLSVTFSGTKSFYPIDKLLVDLGTIGTENEIDNEFTHFCGVFDTSGKIISEIKTCNVDSLSYISIETEVDSGRKTFLVTFEGMVVPKQILDPIIIQIDGTSIEGKCNEVSVSKTAKEMASNKLFLEKEEDYEGVKMKLKFKVTPSVRSISESSVLYVDFPSYFSPALSSEIVFCYDSSLKTLDCDIHYDRLLAITGFNSVTDIGKELQVTIYGVECPETDSLEDFYVYLDSDADMTSIDEYGKVTDESTNKLSLGNSGKPLLDIYQRIIDTTTSRSYTKYTYHFKTQDSIDSGEVFILNFDYLSFEINYSPMTISCTLKQYDPETQKTTGSTQFISGLCSSKNNYVSFTLGKALPTDTNFELVLTNVPNPEYPTCHTTENEFTVVSSTLEVDFFNPDYLLAFSNEEITQDADKVYLSWENQYGETISEEGYYHLPRGVYNQITLRSSIGIFEQSFTLYASELGEDFKVYPNELMIEKGTESFSFYIGATFSASFAMHYIRFGIGTSSSSKYTSPPILTVKVANEPVVVSLPNYIEVPLGYNSLPFTISLKETIPTTSVTLLPTIINPYVLSDDQDQVYGVTLHQLNEDEVLTDVVFSFSFKSITLLLNCDPDEGELNQEVQINFKWEGVNADSFLPIDPIIVKIVSQSSSSVSRFSLTLFEAETNDVSFSVSTDRIMVLTYVICPVSICNEIKPEKEYEKYSELIYSDQQIDELIESGVSIMTETFATLNINRLLSGNSYKAIVWYESQYGEIGFSTLSFSTKAEDLLYGKLTLWFESRLSNFQENSILCYMADVSGLKYNNIVSGNLRSCEIPTEERKLGSSFEKNEKIQEQMGSLAIEDQIEKERRLQTSGEEPTKTYYPITLYFYPDLLLNTDSFMEIKNLLAKSSFISTMEQSLDYSLPTFYKQSGLEDISESFGETSEPPELLNFNDQKMEVESSSMTLPEIKLSFSGFVFAVLDRDYGTKTLPSSLEVKKGQNEFGNAGLFTFKETFQSGTPLTLKAEGLLPNTSYIVYLATSSLDLRLFSQLSEVYKMEFTTLEEKEKDSSSSDGDSESSDSGDNGDGDNGNKNDDDNGDDNDPDSGGNVIIVGGPRLELAFFSLVLIIFVEFGL